MEMINSLPYGNSQTYRSLATGNFSIVARVPIPSKQAIEDAGDGYNDGVRVGQQSASKRRWMWRIAFL